MRQFCVTPAMGKRLIGKGMVRHPAVQRVLRRGRLVIIAGTTNGYVAEEILRTLGEGGFSRTGFRRGVMTPPGVSPPTYTFPGDVVIEDGRWLRGRTILDVVDDLREGDVVLKGANALDPQGRAAVQIESPSGGTAMAALAAVVGRRVRLIVPVGLEKRVLEDVYGLARRVNAPGSVGPRLFPLPGETFTELDAIHLLTGAEVYLVAAGGVYGAEGALWLGVDGPAEAVEAAEALIASVAGEPRCEV